MVAARACSRRDWLLAVLACGRALLRRRRGTPPPSAGGGREVVIFIRASGIGLSGFPGRSLAHALATLTHSTPVTARDADTRDAPDPGAPRRDSGRERAPWRERPSLASFWPGFIKDTCTTRSLKQTKHDTAFLVGSRTSIPDRRRTSTCVVRYVLYEHVCANGWQNLDASDQLW